MIKFLLKYIKLVILGFVSLGVFSFLIFNDYGIIKYFKLKSEVKELHKQLEKISKENKNLKDEIDSLQNKVPAKIEKVAREKYYMQRPGETAIEIREK